MSSSRAKGLRAPSVWNQKRKRSEHETKCCKDCPRVNINQLFAKERSADLQIITQVSEKLDICTDGWVQRSRRQSKVPGQPWRWRWRNSPERRWTYTYTGVHGGMSEKQRCKNLVYRVQIRHKTTKIVMEPMDSKSWAERHETPPTREQTCVSKTKYVSLKYFVLQPHSYHRSYWTHLFQTCCTLRSTNATLDVATY